MAKVELVPDVDRMAIIRWLTSDEFDGAPLGTPKEERDIGKQWRQQVGEYAEANEALRERAEKAEAELVEQKRIAEQWIAAGLANGDVAHANQVRAEKAEAALAEQAKRPSAGDRVRGLESKKYDMAKAAPRLDGSPSDIVTDLLPLIAAELDVQDEAAKHADNATGRVEYKFKYDTNAVSTSFAGETGKIGSVQAVPASVAQCVAPDGSNVPLAAASGADVDVFFDASPFSPGHEFWTVKLVVGGKVFYVDGRKLSVAADRALRLWRQMADSLGGVDVRIRHGQWSSDPGGAAHVSDVLAAIDAFCLLEDSKDVRRAILDLRSQLERGLRKSR